MPRIFMASLGCAKNLVDAETVLGETLGDGFDLALDPAESDVILINTCGFIGEARDEAREVIGEFLAVKAASPRPIKVVAMGCWAQRAPEDVMREFPALDAVWGLSIPSSLGEAIRNLAGPPITAGLGTEALPRQGARLLTTLPSFAYLRIADGCDNRCAYCAIPLIRGGMKSRAPGAILDEARNLADQGAGELVVIGQDITAYGSDRKDGSTLADLLEELLQAVTTPRIRLLYAHPAHLDGRVMELLRGEPRLCGYLDLPIQHVADRVLRAMGRGYGRDRVMEVAGSLFEAGITLRTTILAGFPGETDEDFAQVLELVRLGWFRHLGAFSYSPEPDTPAFTMDGRVSPALAAERRDAVLAAQSERAFAWLDSRVGGREEILIDYLDDRGRPVGRSVHEAPDADGVVLLRRGRADPGQTVLACVTGREGYDLLAETVRAPERKRRRR